MTDTFVQMMSDWEQFCRSRHARAAPTNRARAVRLKSRRPARHIFVEEARSLDINVEKCAAVARRAHGIPCFSAHGAPAPSRTNLAEAAAVPRTTRRQLLA